MFAEKWIYIIQSLFIGQVELSSGSRPGDFMGTAYVYMHVYICMCLCVNIYYILYIICSIQCVFIRSCVVWRSSRKFAL